MQKWAWPALGVFVLACFYGFWWYGPFDLDEGLYAVALMEMQERGDWVMPTYRGEPFWEKPILVFWTAWIADLCGADGVLALRLPSIVGAWLAGYPFMTAHAQYVDIPLIGQVPAATALLFDAGVFALVVGATVLMLIAIAHQSLRRRRPAEAGPEAADREVARWS